MPAECRSVGSKADRTWMMPGDGVGARDEQAVLSECERGEDAALAAEAKAAHGEIHTRRTRFDPAAEAGDNQPLEPVVP